MTDSSSPGVARVAAGRVGALLTSVMDLHVRIALQEVDREKRREQLTIIETRKRFVSQVELVSLHEFSQQRLPLVESLGGSWPLLEDVLFGFFGLNVGFVQTQL